MRLGETSSMRLNRIKLSLTDKLIKKNAPNMDRCSKEEKMAFNQEIVFKKKLKQEIIQNRQMAKNQPVKNIRKIRGLAINRSERREPTKFPLALSFT